MQSLLTHYNPDSLFKDLSDQIQYILSLTKIYNFLHNRYHLSFYIFKGYNVTNYLVGCLNLIYHILIYSNLTIYIETL